MISVHLEVLSMKIVALEALLTRITCLEPLSAGITRLEPLLKEIASSKAFRAASLKGYSNGNAVGRSLYG